MTRTILAIVLLSTSAMASGATIDIVARGTLATYSDPDGHLPFADTTGTAFTLNLRYQAGPAWDIDQDADVGVYPLVIEHLSLRIGDSVFEALGNRAIIIRNGMPDQWIAAGNLVNVESWGYQHGIALELGDWGGADRFPASVTSDALVRPDWPGSWQNRSINYTVWQEDGTSGLVAAASASIDAVTVVPAPGALGLLAPGIGALLIHARRNRRGQHRG